MTNITGTIIRELRDYTKDNYVENHIKIPSLRNGRENTAELINRIMRFVRLLPKELTSLDKAVLMYQIITSTVTYDKNASNKNRYSYTEALKNKKAVCMGISELFCALCTACGIKCKIVIGYITSTTDKDSYHAWVQLYLPDKDNNYSWYMADPTWDLSENRHTWRYFLKSDTYFAAKDHYWLKEDFEFCPFDHTPTKLFPADKLNQVVKIFRQIVCGE